MRINEILSRNLRFIRYSMSMQGKDISKVIGMRENKYRALEQGRTNPTIRSLSRIANRLKLSPHVLLERRDEFIFDNLPFHAKVKLRKINARVVKQLEPINEPNS